jgi:hypothetical protein
MSTHGGAKKIVIQSRKISNDFRPEFALFVCILRKNLREFIKKILADIRLN